MGVRGSGARKKPTALKEVQGTRRPDRDNPLEPELEAGLPLPPDELTPDQQQYYYDFGGKVVSMQVLTKVDGFALASLAKYWDEWMKLTKILEDEGIVYESKNQWGMQYKRRPEWTASIQAFNNVLKLLTEFGLTPASRSKVSVTTKDGNRKQKGGGGWSDL